MKNNAFKTWQRNRQRNMIQLVDYWTMWEVADDNIAVLFKIMQSYHTIKVTCSNRFCKEK